MDFDFKFEYQSLAKSETYVGGKNSMLTEAFGTATWFFLADQLQNTMGQYVGVAWGLSYLITKAVFPNSTLNSWCSMRKFWKGDVLTFFLELLAQAAGAFFGFNFFTWLGLNNNTTFF